ncbi:hypothetical protein DAPPUDRAFT_262457 [Daphnia pulex]|uniref:Uncharacterized protein n=1 Tax=Daphnia pulex TaxID=6669 RepID=E9HN12_DAPPU|nr:hypothetical protein DAPPUDRAFT_262457 [Daphnia pulex]|eukprot:EFX66875.1 hypothetical protein DAPPUDRAFT_262457 [Daphnia pulex]
MLWKNNRMQNMLLQYQLLLVFRWEMSAWRRTKQWSSDGLHIRVDAVLTFVLALAQHRVPVLVSAHVVTHVLAPDTVLAVVLALAHHRVPVLVPLTSSITLSLQVKKQEPFGSKRRSRSQSRGHSKSRSKSRIGGCDRRDSRREVALHGREGASSLSCNRDEMKSSERHFMSRDYPKPSNRDRGGVEGRSGGRSGGRITPFKFNDNGHKSIDSPNGGLSDSRSRCSRAPADDDWRTSSATSSKSPLATLII